MAGRSARPASDGAPQTCTAPARPCPHPFARLLALGPGHSALVRAASEEAFTRYINATTSYALLLAFLDVPILALGVVLLITLQPLIVSGIIPSPFAT